MGDCPAGVSNSFYPNIVDENSCGHQNDGRWAGVANGLLIEAEIDEFKGRITKTREYFRVCQMQFIVVLRGFERSFCRMWH